MGASIDDLRKQLAETPVGPDPRPRIDALLNLAFHLRELEDWDEMFALAGEARELSENAGYTRGIAHSLGIQAFVHYIRSEYETALDKSMKALALAGDDIDGEGKIRSILGLVHWSIGNFDEALRNADRSRTLLHQASQLIDEAFAHAIRGGILHSLGEYEQSIAAHQKSLELFRGQDYPMGVARALAGLGSAYRAIGRTEEAWKAHEESLEIARKLGAGITISRALNDLGELAEAANDYERATELHQGALAIRRVEGYRHAEVTSLANLGRVSMKQGKPELALRMYTRAAAIAEEIGVRPKLCDIEHALAQLHEQAGDYAAALQHFKAYDRLKTELASGQSALRHKAFELEAQLEFARKDTEIHRLRNVELANAIEQLQQAQAELVNSEKMAALGGLVAGVAHEINSPLGVIRSSSDTIVRCAEKISTPPGSSAPVVDALQVNAHLISDATRRIETFVRRLKSFAGIDRADYTHFDPISALDDVIALLEPEFHESLRVTKQYGSVPGIYGYAAEMSQVFMHLIRNAAQAIDGGGVITIGADCDAEHIRIIVADSGRGIASEDIDKLFNPGFNLHDRRVKASLSLFTCLNIVRKHGGDIQVASTPGEGSTFRVVLPRALEHASLHAATA
jgi:two-component system, NtrC family, sensor kinase